MRLPRRDTTRREGWGEDSRLPRPDASRHTPAGVRSVGEGWGEGKNWLILWVKVITFLTDEVLKEMMTESCKFGMNKTRMHKAQMSPFRQKDSLTLPSPRDASGRGFPDSLISNL